MNRLKCTVVYDGTNFSGWQNQPFGRTVQGVIESALMKIHKGREVRVMASGRTDAGVHARGQVLHFDSDLTIPEEGWRRALNSILPADIFFKCVEYVHEHFHSRFDVIRKEYRYRILRSRDPDVFRRHYTYHIPYRLDLGSMGEAAKNLMGKHDFSSFCAAHTNVKSKVRVLETLEMVEQDDELVLRFVGNGFLYQMVRIIVGTLLQVGTGRRSLQDFGKVLESRNRSKAGPTAPGCGLILWEVTYPQIQNE